jgi:hypothetical protein
MQVECRFTHNKCIARIADSKSTRSKQSSYDTTNNKPQFNIHGSVHCNNILIQKFQQDAHVTEFILSDDCSTCFGYHCHPSSGAKTTVTTASGNRYTVLLSAAIVEELEPVGVRQPQHTETSSNSSTIAADNNTV